MSVSLHTVVIGTYQQLLPQAARLIGKAEAFCGETGTNAEDLAKASLAPDMWPLSKQFEQIAHHSARAIVAVREGSFTPQPDEFPHDFAAMRSEIAAARAVIDAVGPTELDSLATRDVQFKAGKFDMMFTAADFLMSFSLPSFNFHLTTAYAILRMKGVELGKPDYLGKLRSK